MEEPYIVHLCAHVNTNSILSSAAATTPTRAFESKSTRPSAIASDASNRSLANGRVLPPMASVLARATRSKRSPVRVVLRPRSDDAVASDREREPSTRRRGRVLAAFHRVLRRADRRVDAFDDARDEIYGTRGGVRAESDDALRRASREALHAALLEPLPCFREYARDAAEDALRELARASRGAGDDVDSAAGEVVEEIGVAAAAAAAVVAAASPRLAADDVVAMRPPRSRILSPN